MLGPWSRGPDGGVERMVERLGRAERKVHLDARTKFVLFAVKGAR